MSQTVYVELAFSSVSLIDALPVSSVPDPDFFIAGVDTGLPPYVFTAPFALTPAQNTVGYFQGNIAVVGATFTPPSNWATDITYVYPVSPLGVQEHIGIRHWLPVEVPDNFALADIVPSTWNGTNWIPSAPSLADPGPTAGTVSAATNVGQSVDLTAAILAQVKPGETGDIETITAVGTTSAGVVVTLINGDLTYDAPVGASVTDEFSYTVTDQLGDQATGTVNMTVTNPVKNPDPGPIAGVVTATANISQLIDLTAAILAQVTPGLVGDTEKITAVGTTNAGGVLKLTSGDLTYASSNGHIPANGSVTDSFTYTVTDQLNDTATGTVNVTVSNPAVVVNGTAKGSSIINGGSQTNILNSIKAGNTIIESGGNDIVNVTAGSATVSTGSGDVVVNLSGKNTTVTGGNGNDTVNVLSGGSNNKVTLGTGTDSIVETALSKGSNTFVLNGSRASLLLYGAHDVAFLHGGTDTITDNSQGLEVKIGSQGGVVTLNNFLADRNGFVDLVAGVGDYQTAKAIVAALQNDGHGGTMLSLGASGHIDFAGVALGSLTASQFHMG